MRNKIKLRKNIKNNKTKKLAVNPKFSMILLVTTSVICLITLIFSTFSWFTPNLDQNNYKNFKYEENNIPLRSETCTFSTYEGTMGVDKDGNENGIITYSSDPVGSGSYSTGLATQDDGEGNIKSAYKYFKTDVINSSYNYSSCVSLFFSSINNGVNLGVSYPSNSYRTVLTSELNDFYLIRNAFVKVKVDTDVDGPGLLSIEWFIKNDSTETDMSITPSNLYLVYN